MIVLRYTALWLVLLVLAFANATARELLVRDALGEQRGQQLSAGTMAVLVLAFTWLAERRWPLDRLATACTVGVIWAALTAAFEFVLTVVVAGKPVQAALDQYNLASGNLWSVLLAVILLAPPVVWGLRGSDPRDVNSRPCGDQVHRPHAHG